MATRVNGFSGMDIDSMVKSMIAAKRVPLDKLNQNKQILEWKRDSYREINSKLYEFRTNKLTDKYGVSSALNANKANVTGNTSAIKAEAVASANGISMGITVQRLATNATLETVGNGPGKTGSTTLAQLDNVDLAILTDEERAAYLDEGFDLTINGVSFKDSNGKPLFNGATTISSMVSTINSNVNANVLASFDEITGKLIIRSKISGSEGAVEPGTATGQNTLLELFNGIKPFDATHKFSPGVNAQITINGTSLEKNSNNFTVNGVDITLLTTTDVDKPATITTQSDPTEALNTIKGFIEDYNSLLNLLNTKTSEAKYRNFAPLSDEQKKEMKESEITAWTEKAQSGLLKNDDILKSTLSSLRGIITENLGGLSSMGITTGQYYEGGKLYLNEVKFKKAISENPQKIVDLFQGTTSNISSGVFDKLADKVNDTLDLIAKRAGTSKFSADLTGTYKEESVMGKELKEYNSRISIMQKNLTNSENRYYKQFAAMETAMNKLNSQSSNLLSSMG